MSRSVLTRLRRLEARANRRARGFVVIQFREASDREAQIADLKARGALRENDIIVCVRQF